MHHRLLEERLEPFIGVEADMLELNNIVIKKKIFIY
jgi:hypothetical protein